MMPGTGWFAEYDLKCAKVELKAKLYAAVCFSCQQIVEKLLKSFLFSHGIKIVGKLRTHDLRELIKGAIKREKKFMSYVRQINYLNGFYIPTRYPERYGGPEGLYDVEDAQKALNYAEEIYRFVRKEIK